MRWLLELLGLRKKKKFKISCSDPAMRDLYTRAMEEAYVRLNKNHFPRAKRIEHEVKVEVVPNGSDMTSASANEVGAAFGSRKIQIWDKWKTNFNLAVHECTHILMYASGYRNESSAHDKRAFPKGGSF